MITILEIRGLTAGVLSRTYTCVYLSVCKVCLDTVLKQIVAATTTSNHQRLWRHNSTISPCFRDAKSSHFTSIDMCRSKKQNKKPNTISRWQCTQPQTTINHGALADSHPLAAHMKRVHLVLYQPVSALSIAHHLGNIPTALTQGSRLVAQKSQQSSGAYMLLPLAHINAPILM